MNHNAIKGRIRMGSRVTATKIMSVLTSSEKIADGAAMTRERANGHGLRKHKKHVD